MGVLAGVQQLRRSDPSYEVSHRSVQADVQSAVCLDLTSSSYAQTPATQAMLGPYCLVGKITQTSRPELCVDTRTSQTGAAQSC
jgi:hypothetical protein